MQFYFAKPLANGKNMPQNFTPKEIGYWSFPIATTVCALRERMIAENVARELTACIQTLPVTRPFKGEEDAPRMRHQRGNRVTEISAPGFARFKDPCYSAGRWPEMIARTTPTRSKGKTSGCLSTPSKPRLF
jgi:hypothetical protein